MYCLSIFGRSTIWCVIVSSFISYVLPMQTDLSQETWPPKHLKVETKQKPHQNISSACGDGSLGIYASAAALLTRFRIKQEKMRRNKNDPDKVSPSLVHSPNDKSQWLSGGLPVKEELEPLKKLFLSLQLFLFLFLCLHLHHILLKEWNHDHHVFVILINILKRPSCI